MNNRLFMVLIGVALLLAGPACQRGAGQIEEGMALCPALTLAPDNAAVRGLQDDIGLLGMLNRLQLSEDQINKLLPVVEKLQQQRQAAQGQVAAILSDLEKALTQKRQLLVEDKPVGEDLEKQVSTLQNLQAAAQEHAMTELGNSAKGVRGLLSPEQLEIVTGRYEARLQAQELLEWLRGLADDDFSEEAKSNAEGLADPDRGFTEETLLKLFEAARKLSAADFEKQGETYTKQLAPLYSATEAEENQQIAGSFSHPHMADLLREKLKVIGGGAG